MDKKFPRPAHSASPHMISRAKVLRNGANELERRLWYRLREMRALGFHFRRQAPFDRYVLDFVCHDRKVVVEIDGDQHGEPEHARRDTIRDARLAEDGYLVLRYGTHTVRTNIDGVLDGLYDVLTK